MAKRDEAVLEELTDEEREVIAEADAEEAGGKDAANAAEADAAVKEATAESDANAADAAARAEADEKADAGAKAEEVKAAEEAKAAADKSAADEDDAARIKATEEAKAADKADKDADAEPVRSSTPKWEAPEDADAQLKELDDKQGELADRFDNGELTAREFNDEKTTLDDQRFNLKMSIEKAGMAQDLRESTWLENTVPAFLDQHAHYRDNATLNGMLDTEVRRLQYEASEAGNDPLSPSILTAAHKEITKAVGALTGKEPATEDAKAEDDAKAKADEAAKAAGERDKPPKTLARVPASDISGTGENRFSSLDRLMLDNPEAFEDAMAKLPDAERERYLAAN